jgi:hypothetical protein
VLDVVLQRNVRISDVNVLEILDLDHLPILFDVLDHFSTRDNSVSIEIHTDWEKFQSLASVLIAPRIQIHTSEHAEDAARKFAASIASTYRLSTPKIALLEINEVLLELDRLLQLKHRLRKLWQETWDLTCKTAVNWVTKTIGRMTRKKIIEQWETRLGNCEVTPLSLWPIARTLLNRDAPKAPTAIHGYHGLKFLLYDKANAIADCLENHFIHYDFCEEHHERRVDSLVQDVLENKNSAPSEKISPCDLKSIINSLKLKKACGIDDIANECLRHLPRRPLVQLTHIFNHCLRLSYFPNDRKEAKVITLPKPDKDPKFSLNLRPIRPLSTTGTLFEKVIQIVQRHLDKNNLLNSSQYGFRGRHNTTLQCMRLTDHITMNFSNNMSTAAVFLDIEKAFDTTWHPGLLCEISKLQFPAN